MNCTNNRYLEEINNQVYLSHDAGVNRLYGDFFSGEIEAVHQALQTRKREYQIKLKSLFLSLETYLGFTCVLLMSS